MALESQRAANSLDSEYPRSSAGRYYYASFQAITSLLRYVGEIPPVVDERQREGWAHDITPGMIYNNLGRLIDNRDERKRLRIDLAYLYKMRVFADYIADTDFPMSELKDIRKKANYIVKVASEYLPGENG